ncbi:MAG: diadenylate cyclase CdaA [bacterium]
MIQYLITAFDFLLVYIILYRSLLWLRNTHAFNLIKGIIFFASIFLVSYLIGFQTLNWVLGQLTTVLLIMMVIIFQPELRRFLERVGASRSFAAPLFSQEQCLDTRCIQAILKAVETLSKEQTGALLAIEVSSNLEAYCKAGLQINADISEDLLLNLFYPGSPTHDGAVIIHKNKLVAAGCLLPLTDTPIQDRRLGTRHRAALGLSELTDAIIIVVSEEKGVISLVENGNMDRFLTREALSTRLFNLYQSTPSQKGSFTKQFFQSLKNINKKTKTKDEIS